MAWLADNCTLTTESLNPNATLTVDLSVADGTLYATHKGTYVDMNPLANVTVMGVESISSVKYNGHTILGGAAYQQSANLLRIQGLERDTSTGVWSNFSTLSWG